MNVSEIRKQFPILKSNVNGKPLVYLDNAATTQKPGSVIDAVSEYYRSKNSNVHRGVHKLSLLATEAFENVRKKVQEFIGAESEKEIIFTKGTTESINLLAFSFGEIFVEEEDEIILTEMEHHANIVPWQMLCERKKCKLKVVPVDNKGELMMAEFEKMLSSKTKIVSITHISNTLGTINPVEEIVKLSHQFGAKVHIDGAQAISHKSINLKDLSADFYSFSSHKMFGPMGAGVLYGKKELLDQMPPYQGGGEMIDQVSFEKTTYNLTPYKFEAGTPNVSAIVGMGAAIDFLQNIGMHSIEEAENNLLMYTHDKLTKISGLKIFGQASKKASVVSFLIDGIHPLDAGTIIDQMGVAVRTGHHCAQPLMDKFGIPGTIRASLSIYNTRNDIDRLEEAVLKATQMLL
jgi:cysteine desulfurase/selenocysteine lyase